jgi:VanZ family protein
VSLISRVLPPIVLMGVIWTLSAQPDLSSGLGSWDTVLRKGAHMTEFGLLWLLWFRALGWRLPLAAAALVVGWAAIDEVHQTTVQGRHGTPVDVLIDSVGVLAAWVVWSGWTRRRRVAGTP